MRRGILTTKLYIPHTHPNQVPRPRLTARLNDATRRKLTLICAPAGFGKTTLLGEWQSSQSSCRLPVAWISLDEGDNDPNRFWAYFATALEYMEAGRGKSTVALLRTMPPPSTELVLTSLINSVMEISEDFALVLDDYHVISAEHIHHGLTFLLDHLPPQMHLAIATRTDPPLPLARLRARGELTEIRTADLRFTPAEVAVFLNEVMGLGLSADDVATLESHTEGWIAGLQLAALSMQEEQNVPRFVNAFNGSHRYVLDYLGDEVLRRQPLDLQSFLLQTSILQRLSGPLCDAVTGQSNGQEMLESLERASLFTVPLDGERRWYRYHNLFADFLRGMLRQTQSERLRDLHLRASEWHERNGFAVTAIDHALAAGDFVRASCLIEKTAEAMLMHGEARTLLSWLEALPSEVVRSRPGLCLAHAWVLVLARRLDEVEPCLQDAVEAMRETHSIDAADDAETKGAETRALLGEIVAIRATVASIRQDVSSTIELSREALRELPPNRMFVRSYIALNMGAAYRFSGDDASAMQGFAEAATASQASGNLLVSMIAISNLALAHARQGHLHMSADLYRYALRLADQHSERSVYQPRCLACRQFAGEAESRPVPLAGVSHVGLARLLYEWNDLDAATYHLMTGIELGKQWTSVDVLQGGYVLLARMRQALGNAQAAADAIREAECLVQKYRRTYRDAQVAAAQARLSVVQGDLAGAARWVEQCLTSTKQYSYLTELAQTVQARLLIAQGKHDEAIGLLEPLLRAAEAAGRVGSVIEILALLAVASEAKSNTTQALANVERALVLAAPEGYVRTFVDEGAPMAALLRKVADRQSKGNHTIDRDVSADYVGKLLSVFEPGIASQYLGCTHALPEQRAEPLSRREWEVLRMIASGLSNTEIAQQLVVALSTVKSHNNAIFAKLNAKNRTQAVARARGLGLLS